MLFLLDFSITGPAVIARTLLLSPSTITRLLDGLERKGLVVRAMYDKLHIVSPTDEARNREDEFLECGLEFWRQSTKLLGDEYATGLIEKMNEATHRLRGVDEGDRPEGDTESGEECRHLIS